jgi:hypothetical protein
MLVGLGGNNGTTIAAGILANKQYVPALLAPCVQESQCCLGRCILARITGFCVPTGQKCPCEATKERLGVLSFMAQHVEASDWLVLSFILASAPYTSPPWMPDWSF